MQFDGATPSLAIFPWVPALCTSERKSFSSASEIEHPTWLWSVGGFIDVWCYEARLWFDSGMAGNASTTDECWPKKLWNLQTLQSLKASSSLRSGENFPASCSFKFHCGTSFFQRELGLRASLQPMKKFSPELRCAKYGSVWNKKNRAWLCFSRGKPEKETFGCFERISKLFLYVSGKLLSFSSLRET